MIAPLESPREVLEKFLAKLQALRENPPATREEFKTGISEMVSEVVEIARRQGKPFLELTPRAEVMNRQFVGLLSVYDKIVHRLRAHAFDDPYTADYHSLLGGIQSVIQEVLNDLNRKERQL